jgi:actin-like ATPase involved in cell morphogenesis
MYTLGIDLGTTFTAAATWRNGHAETQSLGSRTAAIPSVVFLKEDETFLTGEAATRRGLIEPNRLAREFKRRLGDTTPIMLAGAPYSAEALLAQLLRTVVDEVTRREGGKPTATSVSHPANWGHYKTDLLLQAVRLAGIEEPVSFTTEPEAAAVFYAQQQRVDPGAIVAVYDLGGGTFDAAVLRKATVGFEILGRPEGIERLGGIDFDAAVFSHVSRALGTKLAELDEDDPGVIAAVARLRDECIAAKEALSSDTDVAIPVLLPNLTTDVRLTRAELEAMVRPSVHGSIAALKRALESAKIAPEQLHSVLLVGGSSRMPIVSQLVGTELGRPVAVDAHPKHAVALGAAWLASGALSASSPERAVASAAVQAPAPPARPVQAPQRVQASPPPEPTRVILPAASARSAPPPVSAVPMSPAPMSAMPVSPVATPPMSQQYGQPGRASAHQAPAHQAPAYQAPAYQAPAYQGAVFASRPRRRWLPITLTLVAVGVLAAAAGFIVPGLFDDTNSGGQQPTTTTPYVRTNPPAWVPDSLNLVFNDESEPLVVAGDATNGGQCTYTGAGVLNIQRGSRGVSGCKHSQAVKDTVVGTAAVEAEMAVRRGCAGMWMRTGTMGYFLAICADRSVELHMLHLTDPDSNTRLARWQPTFDPAHVVAGLMADGQNMTVYIDGNALAPAVTDGTIGTGRLSLGGFAPGAEGVDATFTQYRAWLPGPTP